MATNFQPLNKETHKNVKIKTISNVEDLAGQHALGVVVQEFALAGNQYPIAFVKDKSESFFPVAILGLEQGKNLFVSEENKWDGMYMPARYTHKPFSVIPNPDDKNLYGIAIDVDSEVVSDSEGDALFNEDGSESEYLDKRKASLMSYVENEQMTKAFVELLVKHDLLSAQNISVKVQGKEYVLNGLNIVDEKKLNALSDEDFLEIRNRGFLGPIFAHLGSMHQVTNLIQRQAKVLAAAEAA
ncbi:SapC family protein [Psychrosphaera sp. B3R10]|uniref:SapC family protein n=1 Tax=unclassified Psychrosphaera TaxID=2641570 RepID=UPI001C0A1537|nr:MULTISPECIES: SapC family protein [unclassified Psychrosphaera]MBU2882910.1 SapC family protein [Psychrosphaera sp. I2R16]MBU2991307.1 SapC family protein [Psychrosphaera sp. B3R10]MDO6720196.1 SapC family protein [Psychrosphaera sp. 1_MG-2023]